MRPHLPLAMLLLAPTLAAQDSVPFPPTRKPEVKILDDRAWHFSLGAGKHTQGLFFTGLATSPSRWGSFAGFASESKSSGGRPPIGVAGTSNFEKVNLDRQSAVHAGVAFRLSAHSALGFGYGTRTIEEYFTGVVPGTGQLVRAAQTKSDKKSGPVLMLDMGAKWGIGVHIAYGYGSFGVAAMFRW